MSNEEEEKKKDKSTHGLDSRGSSPPTLSEAEFGIGFRNKNAEQDGDGEPSRVDSDKHSFHLISKFGQYVWQVISIELQQLLTSSINNSNNQRCMWDNMKRYEGKQEGNGIELRDQLRSKMKILNHDVAYDFGGFCRQGGGKGDKETKR